VGDKWAIANLLNDLGNVARKQAQYSKAQDLYQESLQINQELGDRRAIAFLLEDIASLAMAQSQFKRAVILFSAAAALRPVIGAPLPPTDQEKVEQTIGEARQALSTNAHDEAWQIGQQMTFMQAVEYALQDYF
jgi:tetratricopeptide (TPR) repeat protein